MKVKIGVIICGVSSVGQYVSDAYVQAIKSAGALPIVIPFVKSKSSIEDYVTLCDGFLFCGGGDITPLLFGEEPQSGIGPTDISMDLFQIRMMRKILEHNKPVLAICRGMQILNVTCGGTIYQDLTSACFDCINHMQKSLQRKDVSHKVYFEQGTKMHRLFDNFAYTNSFHHQSIHRLGEGLIVSGKTGDDIVEAIEMPSHTFVVGVQWHPECMLKSAPQMKQLFHALIRFSKI